MAPQPLPLITQTVIPEVAIGCTEWAQGRPPTVGWWKVKENIDLGGRRWWSGTWWSRIVYPDYTEEDCVEAQRLPSTRNLEGMFWCGLRRPHPDPYPYRIFSTLLPQFDPA